MSGCVVWHQGLKLFLVSALQLNLSRPIEEQGPLDVIIHKLTDVILEADQNDSQSLELVHRFQVSGGQQSHPLCGRQQFWVGTWTGPMLAHLLQQSPQGWGVDNQEVHLARRS